MLFDISNKKELGIRRFTQRVPWLYFENARVAEIVVLYKLVSTIITAAVDIRA